MRTFRQFRDTWITIMNGCKNSYWKAFNELLSREQSNLDIMRRVRKQREWKRSCRRAQMIMRMASKSMESILFRTRFASRI